MHMAQHSVYVTGAASGIGEAVARRFLAEGAQVALIDRDTETLDALVAGLGSEDRAKAPTVRH